MTQVKFLGELSLVNYHTPSSWTKPVWIFFFLLKTTEKSDEREINSYHFRPWGFRGCWAGVIVMERGFPLLRNSFQKSFKYCVLAVVMLLHQTPPSLPCSLVPGSALCQTEKYQSAM